MTSPDELQEIEAIIEREGRTCMILSLEGCPPCAALKAAILDRVSDAELENIFEVKLKPYEDRAHRAFIRANAVTGFPTVQLYENGAQLWASAWTFEEAVLEEMLAWLDGRIDTLSLPEPLEMPKAGTPMT